MSEARKLWVYETGDYEQAYTAGGWLTFSEAVEGVKAKYPAPYVVTWGESPNETDEFPELEGDFAGVPGWAYPHRASFRFSAIEFHDAERDSLAASLEEAREERDKLATEAEAFRTGMGNGVTILPTEWLDKERAELSELRARVEAAVELHRPIRNIISSPYWECPTCDELTDESGCKTRVILAPEGERE